METIRIYLSEDPETRKKTLDNLLSQGYTLIPTDSKCVIEARREELSEAKIQLLLD